MRIAAYTVVGMFIAVSAGAQEAPVAKEVVAEVKTDQVLKAPGPQQGWTKKLNVAATASYNHTRNVVGVAANGATVQLGLVVDGALTWFSGPHDWQTTLSLQETQTRTPQLDLFTKSNDALQLKSFYVYHLSPSFGPYAQGKLDTQIFDGYEVRAETTTVVRQRLGESTPRVRTKAPATKIHLTDAFSPLVIAESMGAFARPLEKPIATLEAKAGVGAQQIIAGGAFSVTDDAATSELELTQIDDTNELGGVLEANAKGALMENVSWTAGASIFVPVSSSNDASTTGFGGATTDLNAKISLRLAKWASLDYVLSARKVPLVVDQWQIQNGLLFTAGFSLL